MLPHLHLACCSSLKPEGHKQQLTCLQTQQGNVVCRMNTAQHSTARSIHTTHVHSPTDQTHVQMHNCLPASAQTFTKPITISKLQIVLQQTKSECTFHPAAHCPVSLQFESRCLGRPPGGCRYSLRVHVGRPLLGMTGGGTDGLLEGGLTGSLEQLVCKRGQVIQHIQGTR